MVQSAKWQDYKIKILHQNNPTIEKGVTNAVIQRKQELWPIPTEVQRQGRTNRFFWGTGGNWAKNLTWFRRAVLNMASLM